MMWRRWLWGVLLAGLVVGWCGVAQASPAYKRAKQLYQAFQFQRAIVWLRLASRAAKTPQERARVAVMRALCHYNLGQLAAARRSYEQALTIDRRGALPGGESPAIVAHFRTLRRRWLARHPASRLPVKRRPPTLREQPRRVRAVARTIRRRPLPKPKPGFAARHKGSLILLGIAVAALGGGIGAAVVYQGRNQQLQQLQQLQSPAATGAQLQDAYGQAFAPGLAATILLGSAGALAAVSIGVFFAE